MTFTLYLIGTGKWSIFSSPEIAGNFEKDFISRDTCGLIIKRDFKYLIVLTREALKFGPKAYTVSKANADGILIEMNIEGIERVFPGPLGLMRETFDAASSRTESSTNRVLELCTSLGSNWNRTFLSGKFLSLLFVIGNIL